jgi:DNA-binding transcriptional ArsR family regulator
MLEQYAPIDQVFQALGDPIRRDLIDRLSRGPASVSELAAPYSLTLAAVVQHVQVLERSGLIKSEKVGRVRTCTLDPRGLDEASRWLTQRRDAWRRRLDRLGDFLDAEEEEETR